MYTTLVNLKLEKMDVIQPESVKRINQNFQLNILILLIVLFFGFFAWSSLSSKAKTVKWEYTIESIPDLEFESGMNKLGKQGWELVFARRASGETKSEFSYEMIFKRPAK